LGGGYLFCGPLFFRLGILQVLLSLSHLSLGIPDSLRRTLAFLLCLP
jgi:hypothetical protein